MKAQSHHAPFDRYSVAYPEIGITYLAEVEWTSVRGTRWHSHRELQVLWILDGFMGLDLDGKRYDQGAACYVIPAQIEHQVFQRESAPRVHFLDLRLASEPACTMAKFLSELQQVQLKIDAAQLRKGAHSLRGALAQTTPSREAHLQAVLWEMIAGLDARPPSGTGAEESESGSWKLRAAENLMKDRLAQPLSIDQLAEAAGVSRSQLTRLYIRHFGIGPAERLRQMRINRACELMTTSTLNVKEVAHVCGFVCANHFCRVFLKTVGSTPTEYRMKKLA